MSRALAYAQLLRLPNVFTALADIGLGLFATWGVGGVKPDGPFWISASLLLAGSACLYGAGMVWNDVFDVNEDRRDRPFRPLPSGRVSLRSAKALGTGLLVAGVAFATLAGLARQRLRPGLIGIFLGVAILLYDGGLKRTPLGPVVMGACRFLNVLLGLSLLSGALPAWAWPAAGAVGVYIAGVTLLARAETRQALRRELISGGVLMTAGLLMALSVLYRLPNGDAWPARAALVAAVVFLIPAEAVQAGSLTSRQIQAVIKRSVLGLIVLDAGLATALVGPVGLTLLLLLVPAVVLGGWVYST